MLSVFRGYKIVRIDGVWFYAESGKKVSTTDPVCKACGKVAPVNEHDPCLKRIPRAMNACCGHGNRRECYVQFSQKLRLSGYLAAFVCWLFKR